MSSSYSTLYGRIIVTEDMEEALNDASSNEERDTTLRQWLDSTEIASPYELWNLVFVSAPTDSRLDTTTTVLDYIVDNQKRWSPDEVACFLLEVAEDHSRFGQIPAWLVSLNMPDMLYLEQARSVVWDMFWGGYDSFILELCYAYGWQAHFVAVLQEQMASIDPAQAPEKYYLAWARGKLLEASILTEIDGDPAAHDLANGVLAYVNTQWFDAIRLLVAFHEAYPSVLTSFVCERLSRSYLSIGWRGLALEYATRAMKDNEDNVELEALIADIITEDTSAFGQVHSEMRGVFPDLSPEAARALTMAEFLFRYYGRMLHDYSPIVAGYARAVEIELKIKFLPYLRNWITAYGATNKSKERYVRLSNGNQFYPDKNTTMITLGTFRSLFDNQNPRELRSDHGEFYNCVHRVYGATVDFASLAQYGQDLALLVTERNTASHATVTDWGKVKEIRKMIMKHSTLLPPMKLRNA